jgi:hypothetical protein
LDNNMLKEKSSRFSRLPIWVPIVIS